ncbi:MAG: DUF4422 domain-containing protein [Lachnospiraceae bacterium]|nr:DUF4422 domain-containing protein [Lachnospiraceae bacterium]
MVNSYEVKIVVATHKEYRMPEDQMYLPLQVGAEGKSVDFGYQKDNVGDNISICNSGFCELTGLYWAWKNLDADYIGLVHYRRHFSSRRGKNVWERVLKSEDMQPFLGKVKIFVPKKRRYYIESLYSHYAHTHYACQLDETKKIIAEKYPEYIESYERVVKRTYGYMFNMMIMERNFFQKYCEWLFDILFELEKRLDMQALSDFQKRYYGRVSEILFNVWLNRQLFCGTIRKDEIKEVPWIYMEKINWWKKGTAFLQAKFSGKRYEGSFLI